MFSVPVDMAQGLPPPPVFNSPEYEADVAAAERWFQLQDPGRVAQAVRDLHDPDFLSRLSGVLGVSLETQAMRDTRSVLMRAKKLSALSIVQEKENDSRERPWLVLGHAPPCAGEGATPAGHSCPSGHAAWAWLAGYVLADALPHKTGALMSAAALYSESREVCLLNWHSDIVAGQQTARIIHRSLMREPEYQSALNRIRNDYLDARQGGKTVAAGQSF